MRPLLAITIHIRTISLHLILFCLKHLYMLNLLRRTVLRQTSLKVWENDHLQIAAIILHRLARKIILSH